MHISCLTLVNYRNFASTNVRLHKGINTIIGENGSGKTNLFRAVRLLLDEKLIGQSHALTDLDFHRGLGDWRAHWIAITLEFSEISKDESMQALFLHHTGADDDESLVERATYGLLFRPIRSIRDSLARLEVGDHEGFESIRQEITIDDYETVILGRGSTDLSDPIAYKRIVGDFESIDFPCDNNGYAPEFPELGVPVPRYFSLAKEFSFSYVPALRDVIRDFQLNRNNPLRTLLNAKSDEIAPGDFDSIMNQVEDLNSAIEERPDVISIRDEIRTTFKQTVGETYSPTSISVKSELPLEADKLFQSLKLYVGEHGETYEGGLSELSLGGANLVFLTLKLLEFKYKTARKAIANFLIIEEPEAHIHTHVQKTLFERVEYQNTQIIYSTHSTHISEVSEIERVNVLVRNGAGWQAHQPTDGLNIPEIRGAQRFLDAIRSNLLFARSVMLVEGDAEEIVVPNLIQKIYGVSLDELGLSLINVRSTGFKTLANLFDDKRIRKHCAIVTDFDAPFCDISPKESDNDATKTIKQKAQGSADSGVQRKADLLEYVKENSFVDVFFANHTFEVDFALASRANRKILVATLDQLYTQKSALESRKKQLQSDVLSIYGRASLKIAEKEGKGWFALLLVGYLDPTATLPQYLLDALAFAVRTLPRDTWVRIVRYRFVSLCRLNVLSDEDKSSLACLVERLETGKIELIDANAEFQTIYLDPQLDFIVKAFIK